MKLIHFRKFQLGLLGYNFQLIHYDHFSSGLESMSALHVHFRQAIEKQSCKQKKVSFNTSKVRIFLAPNDFYSFKYHWLPFVAPAKTRVSCFVRPNQHKATTTTSATLTSSSTTARVWQKTRWIPGFTPGQRFGPMSVPTGKTLNKQVLANIYQSVCWSVYGPFFHKTFFCVLDMVQTRKYEFAGWWIHVGLLGQWDNAITSFSPSQRWRLQKVPSDYGQKVRFQIFAIFRLDSSPSRSSTDFPLLLMATHPICSISLSKCTFIRGFVAFNEKSFQTCQPRWLLPAQLHPQSLSTICFCGGSIALELPSHPSHPWFQ